MLKCNEFAYLASDYLDKNLDWKESLSVKFHIFICVHCRRFVRHLLSTIHFVQGMQRQKASSGEIRDIIARIPAKKQA
jgi:hypothetical protein